MSRSVDAIWLNGNLDWLRDRKFAQEIAAASAPSGVGGGGSMRALQLGGGSMKALNAGGSLRALAIVPPTADAAEAKQSTHCVWSLTLCWELLPARRDSLSWSLCSC